MSLASKHPSKSTPELPSKPGAKETQAFSVKRAEVEFHNFAALGELSRALSVYSQENANRGAIIRKHAKFIGPMTPFLEVGANAGHTSYMLSNEFGQSGFALDISADALKQGRALMDHWHLRRAPIRIAGDAAHLPFRDGSVRVVMMFQTLSQFMDIEEIFLEVKRVLVPGGIFLLAEEPLLRKLSLRLYRAPYYDLMKWWEKRLYDAGLLGYLVKDVIGAHQEESFGIRQNHSMYLSDWDRLIKKHFVAQEYELFVPGRGLGEQAVKWITGSAWYSAYLLGGTLSAVCRKAGTPPGTYPDLTDFEMYLRCPDCRGSFRKEPSGDLTCRNCGYSAPLEQGTYTVLPSAERAELYPGDRADIIRHVPGRSCRKTWLRVASCARHWRRTISLDRSGSRRPCYPRPCGAPAPSGSRAYSQTFVRPCEGSPYRSASQWRVPWRPGI